MPVICDSTNDKDIEALFEQIKREQNGRLDILVNNAYAGVQVGELPSHGRVKRLAYHILQNSKKKKKKLMD